MPLAVQQTIFGVKHFQMVGQPTFVTITGNAVRFAGGGNSIAPLHQLLRQRLLAQAGAGNFLQGLSQSAVIIGHRFLVIGHRSTQFAPQATTGKDRQRNRRTDAADTGTAFIEHVQAKGMHTQKGDEVDVRVELGLLLPDALFLCLDHPPCRDNIRTSPQQVGRKGLRQPKTPIQPDSRTLDAEAAIRPGPQQRGQTIALQADLFLLRQQFRLGPGLTRLGLIQPAQVFQTVRKPLMKEVYRLTANFDRARQRLAHREQAGQFGVIHRHCGCQGEAYLGEFGTTGFKLRHCRRQSGPVLTPEIELPAEIERNPAIVVPALRRHLARRQIVVTELLLVELGIGADLRRQRGTGNLADGFRTTQTGRSRCQIRRIT